MATKKKSKSKGKSKLKGRSSKSFDLNKLLGLAVGIYGGYKINDLSFLSSWDPKLISVGKIALGEMGQNQPMIKNLLKNDGATKGAGDGLTSVGMTELLRELGLISGMGNLRDDDEIFIALDGIDDIDVVNEDVLGDDDDIDVINEDVLGDDDEMFDDEEDEGEGGY